MRYDLQESIGFIVSQPPHNIEEDGSVVWGEFLEGGPYGSEVVFNHIESLVIDALDASQKECSDIPAFDEDFTHLYDHPPAAQGLPELAAILWEHGRPLLDEAMVGYQVGKYLRNVARKFRESFNRSEGSGDSLSEEVQEPASTSLAGGMEPRITWTQGALISLVLAELVDRIGYQEDLEIDSHARGLKHFDSPGHPNVRITYLMRAAYAEQQYGYVIDSMGNVSEYFRVDEHEFVSLPAPNLFTDSSNELGNDPLDEKVRLRLHHS